MGQTDRLRALQRLALALLVHAEHQRAFGWLEVEPDDITHLLYEEEIRGELEGILPVPHRHRYFELLDESGESGFVSATESRA